MTAAQLGREPYRLFFSAGVLAGIVGVLLWPIHFAGWLEFYPGQMHGRLMTFGLFGGFILGFLGTSLPRLLSVPPLRLWQTVFLLALQMALTTAYAFGAMLAGDALVLLNIIFFSLLMGAGFVQRRDNPPPGFVLLLFAFLSVLVGALLAVLEPFTEMDSRWIALQRLLTTQGFVLLPILGIGPFLLPRFFGKASTHEFPESLQCSKDWMRKALFATWAGVLILGSFAMEAFGAQRAGYAVRFAVTLGYLLAEVPFHGRAKVPSASGNWIRISLFFVCGGLLAVALLPAYRVGWLHLTLVGGFAVTTFVVASRVVFGHSGRFDLLRRNGWLTTSVVLMLAGMATRVSGDLWPHILPTHYSYGALLWIAGVVLWSAYVLPKTFVGENEN